MKTRNEAVVIKNRGGKILEIRFVCGSSKNSKFHTDGVVEGAMETKVLPSRFDSLVKWLEQSGRMAELEEMLKYIFSR